MTAEELMVERFVQLEMKVASLEEVIEDLQEMLGEKREEVEEYEELIALLQKHCNVDKYGVSFEFKTYNDGYDDCVEQLSAYFDLDGETDDERSE